MDDPNIWKNHSQGSVTVPFLLLFCTIASSNNCNCNCSSSGHPSIVVLVVAAADATGQVEPAPTHRPLLDYPLNAHAPL